MSTRTIDRYVKKGKLSYKKVSNNVLLSQQELDEMKEDLDLVNQNTTESSRERVSESSSSNKKGITKNSYSGSISEFAEILEKKDKTIEEKNQLIFMLQRKVGEIETQMMNMVALPDHTEEKGQLEEEITNLKNKTNKLRTQVRREKMWNAIYMGLIVIAAVVVVLWLYQ